jgi:hypothetical protein
MYIVYGGKVLIIKLVALNKNYRKLKVLGFENRHKTIYSPLWARQKKENDKTKLWKSKK